MNSLTKQLDSKRSELSALTSEALIDRLRAALTVTTETLLEIGAIVRVLEDRGEDLDQLKLGMIDWFRRIAYGQVLPEMFERYRHRPKVLEVIASLPLPDQEKLSVPASLPVLTFSDTGPTERLVDPIEMTPREVRQVFAKGRIRSLTEQRGWLDDKKQSRIASKSEVESGVVVDRKSKSLVINGLRVSRPQLLSYLSQMGD